MLENLRVLLMTGQAERPWIQPGLESLFRNLSTPDSMVAIYQVLPSLDLRNQDRVGQLGKLLSLLDSVAIGSLAGLLPQLTSPVIHQLIIDAIEALAGRDMTPLERVFKSSDDAVVEKLVPILGRLPGSRASQILHKLIHHSSEKIRRTAVCIFLQAGGREVREVMPLIDDPSDVICELACRYLCREKNGQAATQLMDYLAKSRSRAVDANRLVLVFGTLGQCGGVDCLAFLEKVLLGQGWNWFHGFGKPVYRRGAAVALRKMAIPEAEDILTRAAASFFPVIQSAVKLSREGI